MFLTISTSSPLFRKYLNSLNPQLHCSTNILLLLLLLILPNRTIVLSSCFCSFFIAGRPDLVHIHDHLGEPLMKPVFWVPEGKQDRDILSQVSARYTNSLVQTLLWVRYTVSYKRCCGSDTQTRYCGSAIQSH